MTFKPPIYTKLMETFQEVDSEDIHEAGTSLLSNLLHQEGLTWWTIGDILNRINPDKESLEKITKDSSIGKSLSSLKAYMYTSKTWDESVRWSLLYDDDGEQTNIKYGHLLALNSIVNDPEYGLEVALDALKVASADSHTIKWLERYIVVDIRGEQPKPKKRLVSEFEAFTFISKGGEMAVLTDGLELGKQYVIKVYEYESEEHDG